MCCCLHEGYHFGLWCQFWTKMFAGMIRHVRSTSRQRGESQDGGPETYAFLNLQMRPNFSHWTQRG